MAAIGQFWGSFSAPRVQGQPQPILQPDLAPANLFFLNLDAHRGHEPGLFVYQVVPGTSPLGGRTKFMVPLTATVNDGHRLIAHSAQAFTVDPETARVVVARIAPRNGIDYRLDIEAIAAVQNLSYQGNWRNSWGEQGTLEFWRPEAGERVRDVTVCDSWSEYKSWAGGVGRTNFAFRGQSNNEWQLKSSLHRANRFDLWYYSRAALQQLQHELEGGVGTSFDREKPIDFSRLLALGQHHGFPTPLIDFTFSPYIAAYFAMSGALDVPESSRASHVRIYALDKAFQSVANQPTVALTAIEPLAGLIGPSGLHNPRLYAQQGTFLFSNVELVEHLLTSQLYTGGQTYLRAVDIPSHAAVEALTDLSYMGISPASLFPGVDGVCMKIKQQILTGQL
ncbi:FRG domain-containing protein [Paraburkholderia aromaticivorans]|uniref:FRG domain-containing protein n=1 Tax=Paraburkholderia aromaticivorans TaxID=2026199 RepID=UPI001455F7BB|nr:FRG domain-containing protein [Paraburkholderia aromaticivorans]